MEKTKWYRMDNSAMIYPMVITQNTQSIFRLGVALKEPVDGNFLRIGLSTALERFPYFKVELKHGLFRYFLDENLHYPIVEKADGNLLEIFNFKHNRHYLFRLTYYENKIFLDLFHGLCDGSGGIEFLKTIVYYYLKAQNIFISRDNVITLSTPIKKGEMEDAFLKYYKKINIIEGTKKMAGGSAFRIPSKQFSSQGLGLIQFMVNTQKLLDLARSYKTTITVFLSALAMYTIANRYKDINNKDDYVAFIPINLRKIFPSNTLGNFTLFAKGKVSPKNQLSLENFIKIIQKDLKAQTDKRELETKISFTSLMDKLYLLRFMPIFVKSFISKVGRDISPKSKQTMIISNLGKIDFDNDGDFVDYFFFHQNCGKNSPLNMGIVSYKDKTVISFSRKLIETEIEREFAQNLVSLGLEVTVSSNFREECDVL
ncbi:MAG: hypothetical protein GX242_03610 [Clostridiales bacterium]|nr:hypothetical protein [Clostridiales bacterium]